MRPGTQYDVGMYTRQFQPSVSIVDIKYKKNAEKYPKNIFQQQS